MTLTDFPEADLQYFAITGDGIKFAYIVPMRGPRPVTPVKCALRNGRFIVGWRPSKGEREAIAAGALIEVSCLVTKGLPDCIAATSFEAAARGASDLTPQGRKEIECTKPVIARIVSLEWKAFRDIEVLYLSFQGLFAHFVRVSGERKTPPKD